MKYNTVEEITTAFINTGWSKSTLLHETTKQELIDMFGDFYIHHINKKLFTMEKSGNIYDENGDIYVYNIRKGA